MSSQTTAIFTADYRKTFERETANLLRRRFLWFTAIVGAIMLVYALGGAVILAIDPAVMVNHHGTVVALWAPQAIQALVGLIFVLVFIVAARSDPSDKSIVRATVWLVVIQGGASIVNAYMFPIGQGRAMPTWAWALVALVLTHSLASAFLPWSLRSCLLPLAWLCALNAGFLLVVADLDPQTRTTILLLSPLVGLPGVAICAARHFRRSQRSKFRFLKSKYGEVRRELVDARRVHEALFPDPVGEGPIRLAYAYEPMRQIGGDFLYARGENSDDMVVVLADVTGHGIPAALTVNRLHGEIERLLGEDPDVSPGNLLAGLNRYAHLTLAPHSIFLTAFCARIHPADHRLQFANAGHPPGFIRTIDGRVEELASTTFVLGATDSDQFIAADEQRTFSLGDALVLYTDGAIECRDDNDRMFGIERVRAMVAADHQRSGTWSEHLLSTVESYRSGPPMDDTLVVEIYRPLA